MEYNYRGEILSESQRYICARSEYLGADGQPKWGEFLCFADEHGFDTRFKMPNGGYIEKVVLPAGKRIVRYGTASGSYTTDQETDYDRLAMPYRKESLPYHEYIVLADTEVLCFVDKGVTAPGFNSVGGAVQYHHYRSIRKEIKNGVLQEDLSWRFKNN